MILCSKWHPARTLATAFIYLAALGVADAAVAADGNDRERAQLMQMQQQLQKLQADNATLQRDRVQLESQAKEAERLGKESAQKGREILGARKDVEKANQRIAELEGKLQELQAQHAAAIDTWKKAVQQRDDAYMAAAAVRRRLTGEVEALSARLKLQTQRGDSCEVRHVELYRLSSEILDAYEHKRMHWCEPVAGLWQVGEQQAVQALRTRLEALTLEDAIVPPPEASGVKAATQGGAPPEAAAPAVSH